MLKVSIVQRIARELFVADRQQVSFSSFHGHFLLLGFSTFRTNMWISVGLHILSAQVESLSRISLTYQVNGQARFT